MIRNLLIGASLLALSACAAVPAHVPEAHPQIANPAAQGAFLNGGDPAFAARAVPGDWWKLYDDATLNGLVQDALGANVSLREAEAHTEKARAGLDLAQEARGAVVLELALARRDEIDSTRAASPLSKAPDAILVDSTYLSLEEVIEAIVEIVDDKT